MPPVMGPIPTFLAGEISGAARARPDSTGLDTDVRVRPPTVADCGGAERPLQHGPAAADPPQRGAPALSQLIALNVEYGVLLCASSQCRKAVSPGSIAEHLRTIH